MLNDIQWVPSSVLQIWQTFRKRWSRFVVLSVLLHSCPPHLLDCYSGLESGTASVTALEAVLESWVSSSQENPIRSQS